MAEESAEAEALPAIDAAWAGLALLSDLGPLPTDRLTFHRSIAAACQGATFVQECGPDRLTIKHTMLAEAESALAPEVIIASSTSSLTYLNHLAQYCYQPDHQKPLQPISHQSPLYTTQQIPPDLFTITMP